MNNSIRRTIAKIANHMTQNGASQSEAWKSSWKLFKEGWIVTLEASTWNASQVSLRQAVLNASKAHLVIVNCKGKYGNTYRKLQARSNNANIGFIPSKFAEIFKRTDTVSCIHTTELFTQIVGGKIEAKVRLQIIDRTLSVLENAI